MAADIDTILSDLVDARAAQRSGDYREALSILLGAQMLMVGLPDSGAEGFNTRWSEARAAITSMIPIVRQQIATASATTAGRGVMQRTDIEYTGEDDDGA